MIVLLLVYIITKLSRAFGKKRDRQYLVANATLNMFDFINRVLLACSLWPTLDVVGFVITGFYTLGLAVLGIYESQLILIQGRPSWLSFATSATGPYTTRWLTGKAFGNYHKIEVPNQDLFDKCCSVQTGLTVLFTINCIVVFANFPQNSLAFAFAVNGFIFGFVQLVIQVLIKKCGSSRADEQVKKVQDEV